MCWFVVARSPSHRLSPLRRFHRSHVALRFVAALTALLLSVTAAHARHKSDAWARQQFDRAATMREALNGRPIQDRARREYNRVIAEYRSVYFGAPTSTKAEPSVLAVAELMVEMGRRFDDTATLQGAIKQYEFLRREYPGSKYRIEALFTIGEIYKDDLDDAAKARDTFKEFLHRYPRSHLVEEARQALKEAADDSKQAADKPPHSQPQSGTVATSTQVPSKDEPKSENARAIARVTGIRHWSTPDYTRVAIDLEDEVKFESQRIAGPDRIFFDLLDTKLASTLVGKSFDVDDGLLKKIRVAQFEPGKTRIVLEVGDLSRYDAFLLPNPPRLMIDIHGKDSPVSSAEKTTSHESPAQGNDVIASSTADATATVSSRSSSKPSPGDDSPSMRPMNGTGSTASSESIPAAQAESTTKIKKTIVEADDEPEPHGEDATPASTKPISVVARASDEGDNSEAPAKPGKTPVVASGTLANNASSKPHRKTPSASAQFDIREAQPTASGNRSLIRALGLKIGKIVIDPGHGGHDTGTIGPNGLKEKDLVLDVSLRLGKLLESRLGSEVVYTRSDDTFIPLETRTAIANQQQADLFVSVHANSSRDPDARGVETYYLNFTSSPDALETAARENAVSEKSIHELQDLVKKIALKEKIEESHEFASDVESALHSGLAAKNAGLRDRGVKKAPFIVLIGANMPSILAEISFVSNPGDERRLESPEYRQRIAESLYTGIAKYVGGLSGVKLASKIEKTSQE